MIKFKPTQDCPEIAYVQHLHGGDYNYSDRESRQDVVNEFISEIDLLPEEGITLKKITQEVEDSVVEYTQEEIMAGAQEGYGWPEKLGFIVEAED